MGATLLHFPSKDEKRRERFKENLIKYMLKEAKTVLDGDNYMIQEAMALYDRIMATPPGVEVTLKNPVDEPFSERQIEAITAAMVQLKGECEKRELKLFMEIFQLRVKLIEAGVVE